MTGIVNVFIPLTADGERLTGPVPKHRLPYPRSIETRAFSDPDAVRNLSCAIPMTDPGHPLNPKRNRPATSNYAPRGWSLRSTTATLGTRLDPDMAPAGLGRTAPAIPSSICPRCGRGFRKAGTGLAWHVANRLDCARGVAA